MTGRFFLETYGCQMNVADSGLIVRVLEQAGFVAADDIYQASLILLNTCAVRERAEERVRKRLRELAALKRARPDLVLGVTGCMPKHLGRELLDRLPQVDLLVGPDSYRRLPELVARAAERPTVDLRMDKAEDYTGLEPVSLEGIRAFVPIMRGCDRFCTFCVVPLTRGREKSLALEEVVRQVRGVVARGAREVTLLGQTVNSWKREGRTFADLLTAVAGVEGVLRVRFTSPHPSHFDERQFRAIAGHPALCPQVHLPVQSGSNRVLRAMERGYTREDYLELVDTLRRHLPEAGLSTDIIVGFPGETEEDFLQTLSLMEAVDLDSSFMFQYSPRAGTWAHRRLPDDVPAEVKGERIRRVIALQEGMSRRRYAAMVGREVEVLVEGPSRRDPAAAVGKAPDGKTVILADCPPAGELRRVRVARASSHTLFADGVPEAARDEELAAALA